MANARVTNEPANYLALGKQAAKDTEATTFYFLKQLSGAGFQVTWNMTEEREGGDGQEIGLRYKDMIKADGVANGNARYGLAGRLFAWTLGGETVASAAAGATSIQNHVAFPVASLPYLTAEQRYADEVERADNVIITSLDIEGQSGKPLKMTANFMVGGTVYQRDIASSLTPAREVNRPWFFPYGSYVFDGAASYANKVTKFKLSIQRHVDDTIQTTGLNKEDVAPLNFDVQLDVTLKYETRDFYQKVAYLGVSQVQPDFATGSFQLNVLTSGAAIPGQYTPGVATGYLMQVNLPLLQYVDGKANKLEPDGKTMYLDLVLKGIKGATSQVWTSVYTDDIAVY